MATSNTDEINLEEKSGPPSSTCQQESGDSGFASRPVATSSQGTTSGPALQSDDTTTTVLAVTGSTRRTSTENVGLSNSPLSEFNNFYSTTPPPAHTSLLPDDRHHPSYYFPPSSSPSIPSRLSYYDNIFEASHQPPHELPRSYSGIVLPGLRDGEYVHQASEKSGNQENRSADSLKYQNDAFRLPQAQFRLHFPSPKDRIYDHRSPLSASTPSLTSSTTATESSKDGLGPKIWTGTHFLPRFVRAAEVPGEGMCYFYDDGSHCKTVIDGKSVSAHWDVTKSGKPRKRLAIALLLV